MSKLIKRLYPDARVSGASAVDLKKAERALGVLFPDEYKDLFLQTNGAQFGEWTLYPVPTGQTFSLDIVRQNENRPAGLPDDLICIGENLTGDKLCYRIRKRFLQELVFRWNEQSGIAKYPSSSLGEFVDWHVSKRKTNQANRIGRFTVEGNELIVTDPYYGLEEGTDLQLILSNVKSGSWTAAVVYTEDDWVKQLLFLKGIKSEAANGTGRKNWSASTRHWPAFLIGQLIVRIKRWSLRQLFLPMIRLVSSHLVLSQRQVLETGCMMLTSSMMSRGKSSEYGSTSQRTNERLVDWKMNAIPNRKEEKSKEDVSQRGCLPFVFMQTIASVFD
ncbi:MULTISPECIES: SMI1/KNR4 family protein [unclassified Exiguobacterium]|uniref:SMI1/KNR4 family protein n=1 Tax=unclassified Exiguobacterium TaxID=2644629 RepID=UPI0033360A15